MLYQIIMYPIQIVLEVVYFISEKIIDNPGISIIGVSAAVQIITLPLYNMAEKWQTVERTVQKNMKPKIDKIKAVFKGDEQYMILSTYYRQNKYHPIYAMRSTLGLLIQVPFFIAAYTFLSNLEVLEGTKFLIIENLAHPDGLLTIGSFSINILPIIMTLINVISSIIYTKGFNLREKIQLHAMALLFLVLLYNSPSGLVLYWTMNNVFSLLKNIVSKLKKPLKVLYIVSCAFMVPAALYFVFFTKMFPSRKILVSTFCIFIIAIPFFLFCIKRFILPPLHSLSIQRKDRNKIFILVSLSLCVLSGLFIPSALTASSPQEFSFLGNFLSPLEIIQFPFFHSIGLFLFWIPLIYILFSKEIKNILTWILVSFFILALLSTFIFTGDYGDITLGLQFDNSIPLIPSVTTLLLDTIIILVVFIATLLIIKFSLFTLTKVVLSLSISSLLVLSTMNITTTMQGYNNYVEILKSTGQYEEKIQSAGTLDIEPVYNLSKDKENVVIFLLDRAIGTFPKYIFEEIPEVKKQFDGFTWYPNTICASSSTILTVPSLLGGYEYLPLELDKRKTESITSKFNESLLVLPVLFSENNFGVTLTDITSTSYDNSSDITIFNDWDITAQNISGKYSDKWLLEHNLIDNNSVSSFIILQKRLLFFSLFRMSPQSLRGGISLNGSWWETSYKNTLLNLFIEHFAQLDYLEQLTTFTSEKPTFSAMYNLSTHEPTFLQWPNYDPILEVTNRGNNIWNDDITHTHYHVNVASFKALGEWLDYLRAHNVYDNTRIIIVADHGRYLENLPEFSDFDGGSSLPATYNPLLMVKDFNTNAPVKIDNTFMTNADVPFLATQEVITNAINPFTEKPIQTQKENGFYTITANWALDDLNAITYNAKQNYHVKGNIFDPDSWIKQKEAAK